MRKCKKTDFHLENVIISLIGKCSKSLFYSKSLFGYSFLLTTRLDGFSRSLGVKLYFFKTYFLSQVWDIFFRSSVFFLLFFGIFNFQGWQKNGALATTRGGGEIQNGARIAGNPWLDNKKSSKLAPTKNKIKIFLQKKTSKI